MLHGGGVDVPVSPGSMAFVPAYIARRLHTITEELSVLVCCIPAEPSAGGRC
jgi:hypothetical protein